MEQKLTRNQRLVGVAVLAAILALHVWSLMRFPAPNVDEAWLTSRAWALVQTGRAFGPLDAGVAEYFEGYWTVILWTRTFVDALSLRWFATPDLLALRIASFAFGLILLCAVYAIANRLGGQRLGLLSAILASLSMPFLYSSHLARYDIMAAALGFVAIALYLDERRGFWRGLLAGLCIGVGIEVHPNSMIYALAILALHFWEARWAMLRQRSFWGLAMGGIVGLIYYATLHILPYPRTYLALNQLNYAAIRTSPLLTFDLRVILGAFADTGGMLLRVYMPLVVVIVWALMVLLRRRSKADQTLLVLVVSLILAHILLIRIKPVHYAILVTPLLDVLVAVFLLDFVRWPWRSRITDYVSRVIVWGAIIGAIVLIWSLLRTDFWQAYQMTQSRINQSVQPGDTIIASQTYWLGLYDHRYYSWEVLFLYPRLFPGKTLADAFQQYKPDLFIIDGGMNDLISDTLDPSSAWYYYHLPRAELLEYLGKHARLVTSFESDVYGPIRIYRFN